MRIGIVSTWFERGAAVVSKQILDALSNDGHIVKIYARGERYAKGDSKWDMPYVHWAKRLHWSGSGKIDKEDFLNWLQENKIQALIFNEQRWWQPVLWAKDAGVLCGAYVDYYTEEDIENFAAFDFLICNTLRHLSAFGWHFGARYIPWGTTTELFKPSEDLPEKFTFFHSCGWDGHRKGLDITLKAFDLIKNDIDAELLVHTQKDISSWIVCSEKIRVINKTVPAPGLYSEASVYVYPTRLEGIGLTICESLSCGVPVITTDGGPMSEFVQDGVTGFLIPVAKRYKRSDSYYWRITEASSEHLANIMLQAYQIERSELVKMRAAARNYALSERNWETNSKEISNVIEEASFRQVSEKVRKKINKTDTLGFKGKIDYFLKFSLTKSIVSWIFGAYRRFMQPHLYQ